MRSVVMGACVQWEADLKGFLLGVLKRPDLADDAFQKTVIRAIESAQTARAATIRGWLFRIALNEARQFLRQQKREIKHRERFAEQVTSDHPERQTNPGAAQWMLDFGVISDEMAQAIQRSLVRLPAEQQEVIRRRIYKGETFARIAEQMQMPLGTVLTWMRRGLLRLKEDSQLRAFVDDGIEK
ncbi:MAG: RNA polymerase sigma factor [Planctomycetota bacterium]|nr:RNA polymerase sigma factor [Planctomycetota bacterium]